jgi:hypothetical protein
MSGYLPPGCSDSDCEPNDPPCGTCSHLWSEHFEDEDIEYNAEGYVVHACNMISYTKADGTKVQCECEAFNDDEPEPPEYERDD